MYSWPLYLGFHQKAVQNGIVIQVFQTSRTIFNCKRLRKLSRARQFQLPTVIALATYRLPKMDWIRTGCKIWIFQIRAWQPVHVPPITFDFLNTPNSKAGFSLKNVESCRTELHAFVKHRKAMIENEQHPRSWFSWKNLWNFLYAFPGLFKHKNPSHHPTREFYVYFPHLHLVLFNFFPNAFFKL